MNVFVVVVVDGGGGGALCNCVVDGGRGCGGAMPLPLHFTELFIGSSVIAALDSPLSSSSLAIRCLQISFPI